MSLNRLRKRTPVLVSLLAPLLLFMPVHVSAQVNHAPADVVVNAGGDAILISPPPEGGHARMYPIEFAVIAGFGGAGASDASAATGSLHFVFGRSFSRDWGAVDFVPNVDKIFLSGKITNICKADDGFIQLTGEKVTEVDFNLGRGAKGVVYLEEVDENVAVPPFVIKVGGGLGSRQLILRWCQLPEFPIVVTRGLLELDASSVAACADAASLQSARVRSDAGCR